MALAFIMTTLLNQVGCVTINACRSATFPLPVSHSSVVDAFISPGSHGNSCSIFARQAWCSSYSFHFRIYTTASIWNPLNRSMQIRESTVLQNSSWVHGRVMHAKKSQSFLIPLLSNSDLAST